MGGRIKKTEVNASNKIYQLLTKELKRQSRTLKECENIIIAKGFSKAQF